MTETFEQMVERVAKAHLISKGIPDAAAWAAEGGMLIKFAGLIRDELAKGQKPIGWLYSDAYGTHYTDDKREWYDAVGIEDVTPLYARPFVAAPSVVLEVINLLKIWQTWLGPRRGACDDPKLWDRIDNACAMLSAAPADAVAKDAERYRWLREDSAKSVRPCVWMCDESAAADSPLFGENLDAAIDAAMQGKEEK